MNLDCDSDTNTHLESELIRLSVFLTLLALSHHVVKLLRQSPFIPYIVIGALLGPPLADFAPDPLGLELAGFLGVSLNILDAGLSTKLAQIRSSAGRASVVAILGVVFPIGGACLVMLLYEESSIKTAFAAGAAIAPTSLGVTAALLSDIGQQRTDLGVLISVAAIFDDVLSLILLSELQVLDHPSAWPMTQPVLFSALFILFSLVVTSLIFPFLVKYFSSFFTNPRYNHINFYLFATFAITLMFVASRVKTSVLLAAYVTGVAFSDFSHIHTTWESMVRSYIPGLDALFFAATIGFVIPHLDVLFNRDALILGSLLTAVSIAGKMSCALGMWPNWYSDGLPVAVAMLGRGEFGFLIALEAKKDFFTESQYAAVIWAVMIPTLLAPILFRPTFRLRQKYLDSKAANSEDLEAGSVTNDNDNDDDDDSADPPKQITQPEEKDVTDLEDDEDPEVAKHIAQYQQQQDRENYATDTTKVANTSGSTTNENGNDEIRTETRDTSASGGQGDGPSVVIMTTS